MFKPMLAAKVDLEKLEFPVYASPKLDGIRCLIVNGVPVSRNLKPIPNDYVREKLIRLFKGTKDTFDGELMVEGDFNKVQSAIMSKEGEPDFTYYVFDVDLEGLPFSERLRRLEKCWLYSDHISIVRNKTLLNQQDLNKYMQGCLSIGYEGVMLRSMDGVYKYGRSTVKEGYLLKYKHFHTDEARIVRFTQKMHNGNKAKKNKLGYTERSSCKANLTPTSLAGAVEVLWQDKLFSVGFGPGITDADKKLFWEKRKSFVNSVITFSYQELSSDGIPRFGKMLGFRHEDDL